MFHFISSKFSFSKYSTLKKICQYLLNLEFELAPTIPPIAPHTSVSINFEVTLNDNTVFANIAPATTIAQNIIKPHNAPLYIPLLCFRLEQIYPPK